MCVIRGSTHLNPGFSDETLRTSSCSCVVKVLWFYWCFKNADISSSLFHFFLCLCLLHLLFPISFTKPWHFSSFALFTHPYLIASLLLSLFSPPHLFSCLSYTNTCSVCSVFVCYVLDVCPISLPFTSSQIRWGCWPLTILSRSHDLSARDLIGLMPREAGCNRMGLQMLADVLSHKLMLEHTHLQEDNPQFCGCYEFLHSQTTIYYVYSHCKSDCVCPNCKRPMCVCFF